MYLDASVQAASTAAATATTRTDVATTSVGQVDPLHIAVCCNAAAAAAVTAAYLIDTRSNNYNNISKNNNKHIELHTEAFPCAFLMEI